MWGGERAVRWRVLFLVWLALPIACEGSVRPGAPDGRARAAACELDTVVTPLRPSDAVRLRFATSEGGQGVVEAGSRAAFGVVRYINRSAAAARSGSTGVKGGERVDLLREIARGPDGLAHTQDDRPFVGLADLRRRGGVDVWTMGLLIEMARLSGSTPPPDLEGWVAAEGVLLEMEAAQKMVGWIDTQPESVLVEVLGGRAATRVADRRPVRDLETFVQTPYVGRVEVVRVLHLSVEPPFEKLLPGL